MQFIANYINPSIQKKKVLLSSKALVSVIFMSTSSILSAISVLSFLNMPEWEKTS